VILKKAIGFKLKNQEKSLVLVFSSMNSCGEICCIIKGNSVTLPAFVCTVSYHFVMMSVIILASYRKTFGSDLWS